MAKTYNTIGTFTAGAILTAAQMNQIGTNVNNSRVPSMCKVARVSSAQSITPGAAAYAQWNSELYDTDGMYDAGSNTRITIGTVGVYSVQVYFYIQWSAALSHYVVDLTQTTSGGTETTIASDYVYDNGGNWVFEKRGCLATSTSCAVGDYFRFRWTANVGGSSHLIAVGSSMSANWVGQVS
jgi:hypothetical protein